MSGFLVDTNVISELIKQVPNKAVCQWIDQRKPAELYLASMTIGELMRSASKIGNTRRGKTLLKWVEIDLTTQFSQRILPFDGTAAAEWGRVMGESDRLGKSLPFADAQIAAIARVHQLTIVTRNVKDFERMFESVLNPFDANAVAAW